MQNNANLSFHKLFLESEVNISFDHKEFLLAEQEFEGVSFISNYSWIATSSIFFDRFNMHWSQYVWYICSR